MPKRATSGDEGCSCYIFEEMDDSYGVDVARRNLASALVYQNGRSNEVDEIIQLLDQHAHSQESRRHRAWLCNILVRRNRDADRPLVYPTLVLLAAAGRLLTPFDLSRISLSVAKQVPGLNVRLTPDGSSYWYIQLSYDQPVMVTLSQLDETKHSALAMLVVALFLKGFETELARDVFGGISLRPELEISVTDIASMPSDLRQYVPIRDVPCQSSRPVSMDHDDPTMPTYVFLNGDIFADTAVGEGRGGSLQILLGIVTLEAAFRLLNGKIDLEVLQPKLVELVRESIS